MDMDIGQFCRSQDEGGVLSRVEALSLMQAIMTQLNLSTCAYHRTRSVKLARTIADLAGVKTSGPRIGKPIYNMI